MRYAGVRVDQGCTFLQQGALVINAPNNETVGTPLSSSFVVLLKAPQGNVGAWSSTGVFCLGEWQQLGSFQANSSGHHIPCLGMDMGCLPATSKFTWKLKFIGRFTNHSRDVISCARCLGVPGPVDPKRDRRDQGYPHSCHCGAGRVDSKCASLSHRDCRRTTHLIARMYAS